jgi:hypothetical protein
VRSPEAGSSCHGSSPYWMSHHQPRGAAASTPSCPRQIKQAGLLERRPWYYIWKKITVTTVTLAAGWAAFAVVGDWWWQLAVRCRRAAASLPCRRREDQIDVHAPAPGQVLGQDAAEQQPDGAARGDDRPADAERLAALLPAGKGRSQHRQPGGASSTPNAPWQARAVTSIAKLVAARGRRSRSAR